MLRIGWALAFGLLATSVSAADVVSHPPTRPLPVAYAAKLADGVQRFVDPVQGNDENDGSEGKPWKTIRRAERELKPGDTLALRAGVYYEKPSLTRSGAADAPITIRNYPGELAILDGGVQEFFDDPAGSWMPLEGGAEGEYVSKRTFREIDTRRAPTQFIPGSWEPLWGIESDRPLALGHFADSMTPLHGYRWLNDLRSTNELWIAKKSDASAGFYCGPGLWYNRDTGRVHVRLAHTKLAGLGDRAYAGETDPRKLRLCVALGFGDDVLRINGVEHVKIQGLVFRGATGSPMLHVYGSKNIELDHLTLFGGFPSLTVNASQGVKVTHCAFRGIAAPWTGRSHMKYRGTATYAVILQNGQPMNDTIEFAWNEFTDGHDGLFLRFVNELRFHHNFVDNFNDDGLECGAKLRNHTFHIHENRIGACLLTFTQHEIDKDESPADHAPKSGMYVYRNVIDGRAGVPYSHPSEPDATGSWLRAEIHLLGDHGSPTYPVMRFYHNTFLRRTPVFRDSYLFGLGGGGMRKTERDVLNNIFVQMNQTPGTNPAGLSPTDPLREGGNLLWGYKDVGGSKAEPFAKFRASKLYQESKGVYEPGWTTLDRVADPKFVQTPKAEDGPFDLRLKDDSPAVNAGVPLPPEWPDPYRERDADGPDIGALPLGAAPWGVGVDGRIPLFGEWKRAAEQ